MATPAKKGCRAKNARFYKNPVFICAVHCVAISQSHMFTVDKASALKALAAINSPEDSCPSTDNVMLGIQTPVDLP